MQNIIKQIVQELKKNAERMNPIQSHEINYDVGLITIKFYRYL